MSDVYKKTVLSQFAFLKRTTRLDDLLAKSIGLPDEQGYLIPVCEFHIDDRDIIADLAKWREENALAFPTQFTVSLDGTANWLKNKVLAVPDRMLFLVADRHGRPIGHIGLANAANENREVELDNIVRGIKDTSLGIMTVAVKTLLAWLQEFLMPNHVFLRVFEGNQHAIDFYQNLGFKRSTTIPLRRHVSGDFIHYEPLEEEDHEKPDKEFLLMVYEAPITEDIPEVIQTAGPSISARETSYVLNAVQNGWGLHWRDYISQFEQAFAEYLGTKYALSTSSCTGALHLALLALDIGPGDEVIVPDSTWVATAAAVTYVGATPVFADVERESWCLDPTSFESLISDKTRAVIPVHLYGHPARMDKITQIAKKHGLDVIEDAAPAIGAEFAGQKTGTFGRFAAFSFQGAKLMVTGEGGMLVTNDTELFNKAQLLWDQGRDPNRTFWINQIGWKYKMSNIQAALGLAQLERVDELIAAKRRLFTWYEEGLRDIPHITLMHEQTWAKSIYWMSSIVLKESAGISRDELRKKLLERNIDTRPVFPAISQYPIWPKSQPAQPVAKWIGDHAINLPSKGGLTAAQVQYVCENIKDILTNRNQEKLEAI